MVVKLRRAGGLQTAVLAGVVLVLAGVAAWLVLGAVRTVDAVAPPVEPVTAAAKTADRAAFSDELVQGLCNVARCIQRRGLTVDMGI